MMLIKNGVIITRNQANQIIENGALAIQGDKIIEVGTTVDLEKKHPYTKIIDAQGKLVMPGFINTHHHIYSALARGKGSSRVSHNFTEILENLWWPIDKALSLEQVAISAYVTMIDCIKNGVTTIFDHHASQHAIKGSLKTIARVSQQLGLRAALCYEVTDRDGAERTAEAITENIEFARWANDQQSTMIKGLFGLHASFTLSKETLKKCVEAEKQLGCGFHVHVAEAEADLLDARQKYGKGVVQRLYDEGVLKSNTLAVHCIHIDEQEMDLLKKSGCAVIHNPESNMGNAVGCQPTIQMMEKDLLCGLGSDGYTSDMMESYKVANIIHKHELKNPNAAWTEIPAMLFDHNRIIANRHFDIETGVLQENAQADIIVVNYDPITPLTSNNINAHLLFGINGRQTETTIINGTLLMENNRLINIDEKSINEKSRNLARSLWQHC